MITDRLLYVNDNSKMEEKPQEFEDVLAFNKKS